MVLGPQSLRLGGGGGVAEKELVGPVCIKQEIYKKYKKVYMCVREKPSTGPISLQVSRVHLSGE
jgi:hypothetical protein